MSKVGGAREDRTPDLSSAIALKGANPAQNGALEDVFPAPHALSGLDLRSASDPRPVLDNLVPRWPKALYFVACDNQIKIGSSDKPGRRLVTMRTGNTRPMELLAVLPAFGWQEKVWHSAFWHDRQAGEWFRDTPDLRNAIGAAVAGREWIATLRHPYKDDEQSNYRWRERIADMEEHAEVKAHAQLGPAPRCTPGNHRCLALGLWVLGVMNGGPGVAMARSAAAQCEAGL